MKILTESEFSALVAVANSLGVPLAWLQAVINFETAGTWDPAIKNPLSSARGLIQFLDKTAISLGYQNAAALVRAHPTIESQLKGPVLKYFRQFSPFKTQQDFFFSVFLPRYRRAALDTVIFAEDATAQDRFQKANPGIITVGDYYHKLRAAFARHTGKPPGNSMAAVILALAGAVTLFFLRR